MHTPDKDPFNLVRALDDINFRLVEAGIDGIRDRLLVVLEATENVSGNVVLPLVCRVALGDSIILNLDT